VSEFEEIYRTYMTDVYRYARGLTLDERWAEEVTQETFFRAMRSLHNFRGECEVRVWLCHIAKNIVRTEQRRRGRYTEDDTALQELTEPVDLTELVADRQTALSLHRLLHRMEEPYKEVFSLRVFGELSFAQIGELFGRTDHWACVTFHRAKEKIQKEMSQL